MKQVVAARHTVATLAESNSGQRYRPEAYSPFTDESGGKDEGNDRARSTSSVHWG